MLQSMQQIATTPLPTGSPTFAGLLAALTAPAQRHKEPWGDVEVEDDVVSLTYERALRAHSRYRSPELADRSLGQPGNAESLRIREVVAGEAFKDKAVSADRMLFDEEKAAQTPSTRLGSVSRPDDAVGASHGASVLADRNLKSASITIRLSVAECLQLRQRAGEAGLTVSAYLRSCTFEAESLRELVEDTLAKLRSEPSVKNRAVASPGGRTFRQRLAWLWPSSRIGERDREHARRT
jgi:hypothetical protein